MNISAFRSITTGRFARSFAKQKNFDAYITFPNSIGLFTSLGGSRAQFEQRYRIDSFEFPGRTVQTFNTKPHGYGLLRKNGYDSLYSDVAMTMLVGKEMAERTLMTDWQDLIIGNHKKSGNTADGALVGYYQDYIGRVTITQYGEDNIPTFRMILEEAFPISVSPLAANWASADVHRLTVQFAYRYFTEENIGSPQLNVTSLANFGTQQLAYKLGNKIAAKSKNAATGDIANKFVQGNIPNIKVL